MSDAITPAANPTTAAADIGAVTAPFRLAAWMIAVALGAAVLWAGLAPLATSVHVAGAIAPTGLTHAVQDPTGGRIAALHVQLYDRVEQGSVLAELDRRAEAIQLARIEARAATLATENRLIDARIGSTPGTVAAPVAPQGPIAAAYAAADHAFDAAASERIARRDGARARAAGLRREGRAEGDLFTSVLARRASLSDLVARGARPPHELQLLDEERLRLVAASVARDLAIAEAERAAAALDLEQATAVAARAETLADRRTRNTDEAVLLAAQIAQLQHTIASATLRAPVGGSVTALNYPTAGMTLPPGASLAAVAQDLARPQIDLRIPPRSADQVFIGQRGVLTLPGLPRRNLPTLHITITDIAADAVTDSEGKALHYLARAAVDPEDWRQAGDRLGADFRVVSDMPLAATLAGHETTALTYLIAPLLIFRDRAFED